MCPGVLVARPHALGGAGAGLKVEAVPVEAVLEACPLHCHLPHSFKVQWDQWTLPHVQNSTSVSGADPSVYLDILLTQFS